jgi:hypothetical protein
VQGRWGPGTVTAMKRAVLTAGLLAALVPAAGAQAATITVDRWKSVCPEAAHTSVQAAVDAAAPGDTIRVCTATYEEHVRVSRKDLTFEGVGWAPPTLMLPGTPTAIERVPGDYGDSTSVLRIDSTANVTVRRMTISGRGTDPAPQVTGILATASGLRLEDVTTRDMPTYDGVGIRHRVEDGSTRTLVAERLTVTPMPGTGLLAEGLPATNRRIAESTFTGPGRTSRPAIGGIGFDVEGSRFSAYRFYDSDEDPCGWGGGQAITTQADGNPTFKDNVFTDVDCAFNHMSLRPGRTVRWIGNRMTGGFEFAYVQDFDFEVRGNHFVDVKAPFWVQDIGGEQYPHVVKATFVGNSFVGGYDAIRIDDLGQIPTARPWTIRQNRFSGQQRGVMPYAKVPVDLRDNWWGCDGLPGDPGCITVYAYDQPVQAAPRLQLAVEQAGSIEPGKPGTVRAAMRRADGTLATDFPRVPVALTASTGELSDDAPAFRGGQAYTTLTAPQAGTAALTAKLDRGTATGTATVAPAPAPETRTETCTETVVVERRVEVPVAGAVQRAQATVVAR